MGVLDGHVALVTGAGRGFGRAIAERLAREGAAVAVTARSKSEIDDAARMIEAAGARGFAVAGDITKRGDIENIVHATEKALGPLSLIVSNAGVPWPFGPLWVNDPEKWWAAQEVHVKGPMMLAHAVLPGMVARRKGRMIFVSAIASHMTVSGLSAYIIGKTAQRRLAELVAFEARDYDVSAFSIDPGFVFTQLAEDTMNSPEAQKYLPNMVERLREMKARGRGSDEDYARCAQRCVDLASGRYDALSGSYSELPDDLEKMLREKAAK
ncbi:MAG: SDR family oxidoreductase [Alphaproteobacteria bacterium]